MSKRRAAVGGYEESSDGLEPPSPSVPNPPPKKTKFIPYAPLRLTAVAKAGSGDFQFPRSASSSSYCPTPSGSAVPVRSTSLGQNTLLDVPGSNSYGDTEPASVPEVQTLNTNPSSEMPTGTDVTPLDKTRNIISDMNIELNTTTTNRAQSRNTIVAERQLNEIMDYLNAYSVANDAKHKQTQDMLSRLLEISEKHLPRSEANDDPQALAPANEPTAIDAGFKIMLSNPPVTPELAAIVMKVVGEARSRIGKKKGGPEENSLKEHARKWFYRMIGITAAKFIPPHFEDEFGEPDTLPTAFIDPQTGYCIPRPHWKASLLKQIAWVPTYILWFKSPIPNDGSELSAVLRNLSDEQIVTLLHDGPLKTCQTTFRDMRKSDEEIQEMRGQALKYRRTERKASGRAQIIATIPSLRSQDWGFLSHPGYTSEDESDGEGGVVTKQPDYRAQWVTNIFEAIGIAQFQTAQSRPGICPSPPHRRIEIVKRPIPNLERGTGSSRVPIRIALCSISRSWRNTYPDELQKYQHLINHKANTKPDIDTFLAQHPMRGGNDGNENKSPNGNSESEVLNPAIPGGSGVAEFVNSVALDPHLQDASNLAEAIESSGQDKATNPCMDAEDTNFFQESYVVAAEKIGINLAARYEGSAIDPELPQNFPIDILGGHGQFDLNEPAAGLPTQVWPGNQSSLEPICSSSSSRMPPPPLPSLIDSVQEPHVATGKAPKPSAPQAKRRGRPPGSKNKPKTVASS
ncbi:hypothetical protein RhiJN_02722 [Ceratobasidium sp. AG-Ba]|nr:hypothetical protein RhiJN_02722 [Ceratobasidium sp. AG-Ba]